MSDELFLNDWGVSTVRDFGLLFCGDRLGYGMSRSVYELAIDPTKVVKIEGERGFFQNVIEWETWQSLGTTPHGKWLAPCRWISPCGIVLVMDKTAPLSRRRAPPKLPEWLTDTKLTNYGLIGRRVVCHDYGTNMLLNHGAFGSKQRKVRGWWS